MVGGTFPLLPSLGFFVVSKLLPVSGEAGDARRMSNTDECTTMGLWLQFGSTQQSDRGKYPNWVDAQKFIETLRKNLRLWGVMSNAAIEAQIRAKFDAEVGLTGEHPATIIICDEAGQHVDEGADTLSALLLPGVRGVAIIGDLDGKPTIRFYWRTALN